MCGISWHISVTLPEAIVVECEVFQAAVSGLCQQVYHE